MDDAQAIAEEWVTAMRLEHVLQSVLEQTGAKPTARDIGTIIKAMFEDIQREGAGEIVWSRDVEKAVGSKTASMLKKLRIGKKL